MRPWVLVMAGLLALLHLTLRVGLGLGSAAPDLMLLSLLIVSREVPIGTAAGVGLVFGLLEDALAVLSFGANTVTFAVVAGVGSATREVFVGDSPWFGFSFVFLGKLSRDVLHWILVGPDLREPFVQTVVLEGGVAAFYVAVVGGLLFAITGLRWDTSGTRR